MATEDMRLMREYVDRGCEAAFAELVRRYTDLTYSAALRQVGNAHLAEEVTQVVFVILAQKARSLRPDTILLGWLYSTTRFVSRRVRQRELRRRWREQEAHMQSSVDESPDAVDAAWRDLAPLLDEAMSRLRPCDRDVVLLRYFQDRSLDEIGAALGIAPRAAQKRVSRSLEKLRAFFARKGVVLTSSIIGGVLAAHSVQAAPVGLSALVSTAAAKGTVGTGSSVALVKGVLKLMAWTKVKLAATAGAVILAAGTTVVATKSFPESGGSVPQVLEDGSVLALNRAVVGTRNEFYHGSPTEKLMGNLIPAKGIDFLGVKLKRREKTSTGWFGRSALAAEFHLTGSRARDNNLVRPGFYRQFRCVLHGESGIEYVQEFQPDKFRQYADGYFGYVTTGSFPRESKWLWFRIERREEPGVGGPWTKVAEFKVKNPARSENKPWTAEPSPTVRRIDGMEFVLNEITMQTRADAPRDIWNHMVDVPVQVRSNGVVLTNWAAAYTFAEDASGNWEVLRSHRGLNPRFVWKIDMDMEPQSDFAPDQLHVVHVPVSLSSPITTNVAGVPVTISWRNTDMLSMQMPTNRTEIAIKFVSAEDEKGRPIQEWTGNWGQYGFSRKVDRPPPGETVRATFAIVPNVRVTYYVQPRRLTE